MRTAVPNLAWLATELRGEVAVLATDGQHMSLFGAGLERLNGVGRGRFRLSRFGSTPSCVAIGRIALVLADNGAESSPALHTVIAVDPASMAALLPGVDGTDLRRLLSLTDTNDLYNRKLMEEFCVQSYGFCFRECRPVRIESDADAHRIGIAAADGVCRFPGLRGREQEVSLCEYRDAERSLWWQAWGGELYEFHLQPDRAGRNVLGIYVGYAMDLPVSVRR